MFNTGSANFFDDKAKAMREMTRVAESGTAILIGEEIGRVGKHYSSLPIVGKNLKNKAGMMRPPVELVP